MEFFSLMNNILLFILLLLVVITIFRSIIIVGGLLSGFLTKLIADRVNLPSSEESAK
jgi:hypothetical protein